MTGLTGYNLVQMPRIARKVSTANSLRLRYQICPVDCPMVPYPIRDLADYLNVLDSVIGKSDEATSFWFRGQADLTWNLVPGALRYSKLQDRNRALKLVNDFRRSADIRLNNPPPYNEKLKWIQLAQHYGLPTRLLDWTSNAAFALLTCCEKPNLDGMVYLMKPADLCTHISNGESKALDPDEHRELIEQYLRLDGRRQSRGTKLTLPLLPIENSERIQLQRGVFTLHGNRYFELCSKQAPSLCYLPIRATVKMTLVKQLRDIGIDRSAVFPELDNICKHLKVISGLEKWE